MEHSFWPWEHDCEKHHTAPFWSKVHVFQPHGPCTQIFFLRSISGKASTRYWYSGAGQHSDAYIGITPESNTTDTRVLAQRLVSQCRNSGVSTSSTPPQHFAEDQDVYSIDRDGEECQSQFECPGTLKDMMIIAHEYQGKRATAIAQMQQNYTSTHNTPRLPKTSKNNYDFFCPDVDKPPMTTLRADSKELTTNYDFFCSSTAGNILSTSSFETPPQQNACVLSVHVIKRTKTSLLIQTRRDLRRYVGVK